MITWAFYPVFVATLLSMVGWSYFVQREHGISYDTPLSDLATRSRTNALYYQILMIICPLLFAITALWFVMPRIASVWLVVLWLTATTSCVLAGVFLPRYGREKLLHSVFAYTMAAAMLLLACMAAIVVPNHNDILWYIFTAMTAIAIMGQCNKRYYVFYELGFIFLSHLSMIVITLAIM